MAVTSDVAAERAVLSGICQHGTDCFLDVTDYVKTNTFSVDSNKIIFKCIEHICKTENLDSIDLPSILSASKELNLNHIFDRKEEFRHLNSILQLKVNETSVRRFAGKLRRLEIARLLFDQGSLLQEKMSEVDGTETVSQLLGTAENVIFDFTSLFDDESDLKPIPIGEGIAEYVDYLIENPGDISGLSTGYEEFDSAIGGGLLPGVTMIGARAKVGKTTLSVNIAKNVAEQEIPVLYLDTEMVETGKYRDISLKLLGMISGVDINDIKSGQMVEDPEKVAKVREASKWIEDHKNFSRISIAGKSFEDQLYVIRRWIQSEVGLNPDGSAKDCLIIYDYLKLMDTAGINESVKEFQMLGMMMTALQNMAIRYAIPIISFTQLNRDGLDGEHAGVVAGSDRITWFCTAFCIFKYKSREEIETDGPEMGNRKMVVVLSRYGPGHDFGEYCNFMMNKWKAQIVEVNADGAEVVGDFFEVVEENENDAAEMEIPFN